MSPQDQDDDDAVMIVAAVPAVLTMEQQHQEYDQHAERMMNDPDAKPADIDSLGTTLISEFTRAIADRQPTEERWVKDLRQYKGQYDPEVLALIGPDRSTAFVRKTRVKVKTTDSRVEDMLFPAGADKHWSVEPTPKSKITDHHRNEIIQALQMQMAQMNQQQAAQAQEQANQSGQPVQAQPAQVTQADVEAAVLAHAKTAARGMDQTIVDQLIEAQFRKASKAAIHSCHLYGTGIIKGPLVERRVRTEHVKEGGKWISRSVEYVTPFVDFTPLWRFYPDMSATELSGCSYVYELHDMTRSEFAALTGRKSFNKSRIVNHINTYPNGHRSTNRWIENELKQLGERNSRQGDHGHTYEVLERWGYLTGEQLRMAGVEVPDDRTHETFFSNVWLLPTGEVIKAVLQPIDGITWPYHIYYFDKDETSIFAEGIPAVMRDDQEMINAATRMVLDNGALSAGPMFEVNHGLLSNPDGANSMRPWKVFSRNNTAPGQKAINLIQVDGRLGELMSIADRFEVQADETTAIPRYMSGENVNSGAAGTASGMSMLMGAANIVLKDLVSNWDDLIDTFIRSMYLWNMKFHSDDRIKGDYKVKVTGAASLVAKEIRARQINELAAATANPMDAPYIKRDRLNKLRAEAFELGDLARSEEEVAGDPMAKMQQELAMKDQQMAMAEREAKIGMLTAQAERFKAESMERIARAALNKVEATDRRLESVFVALQAAGIAIQDPRVAAAGDEILRSAGWEDATPDPSMANLGSLPGAPGAPVGMQPGMPGVVDPAAGLNAAMQPSGGGQGQRSGVETMRNEGVPA
jgi:hypothetical protein